MPNLKEAKMINRQYNVNKVTSDPDRAHEQIPLRAEDPITHQPLFRGVIAVESRRSQWIRTATTVAAGVALTAAASFGVYEAHHNRDKSPMPTPTPTPSQDVSEFRIINPDGNRIAIETYSNNGEHVIVGYAANNSMIENAQEINVVPGVKEFEEFRGSDLVGYVFSDEDQSHDELIQLNPDEEYRVATSTLDVEKIH